MEVIWGHNPVQDDRSDFTQSSPLQGDISSGDLGDRPCPKAVNYKAVTLLHLGADELGERLPIDARQLRQIVRCLANIHHE